MIGLTNYASTAVPEGYVCGQCGATRCKLWREYNTPAPGLYCADCAAGDQERDISDMDADGCYTWAEMPTHRISQIGWLVPAVPTEEGGAYWGHLSTPHEGWAWWRRLPNTEKK